MAQGIYRITCKKIQDKQGRYACYIGSSTHIEGRWYQHLKMLQNGEHHSWRLQRAFTKFGILEFSFEIIKIVARKENLIKEEQILIDNSYSYFNIARIADRPAGRPTVVMAGTSNLPSVKMAAKIAENNDKLIQQRLEAMKRSQSAKSKPKLNPDKGSRGRTSK